MYVKVCGLRTEDDVAAAVSAGADAVGFVFTDSARRVDAGLGRALAALVPPQVLTVAVVSGIAAAEAGRIAVAAGVRALQLHGDYPRSAFAEVGELSLTLVRATTLDTGTDTRVGAYGEDVLLLDSPVGGTGVRWDLDRLHGSRPGGKWLLAGGLRPENVANAIAEARPWGVDVSSGVESRRGVKDHGRIREFVAAAKAAPPV